MKACRKTYILLVFSCILLYSGLSIHAFSYDYSATAECLVEPQRALYGGGIIVNPEFANSIEGWTVFGEGAIEERISKEGNRFIVAHSRTRPRDSFSQKVQLQKGKLYSLSAWVQISEGSETVSVVFKTNTSKLIRGGEVVAEHGCWNLLKGGIVANFSSPVEIIFQSRNATVEIWVDSISLQPFTKKQWRSHQDNSIEKVRKSKVRLQITHTNKTAIEGARVFIKQTKSDFPFGSGINYNILRNTDYQDWFKTRFSFTTFTNEMKWYSTEKKQGVENYTIADAMVKFAKQNGISIRGHNIFWDNPKYQPDWVKTLSPEEIRKAAERRINSVVTRYRGELIAWDVVNENLHFRFFEDKLGENASAAFYNTAYQLDPGTTMFMNEYNTIEYSKDEKVTPANYKKKLQQILSYPGNAGLPAAIGLQGHFGSGQPNIAYMRSCLDILGTTGLPIWLTEVDVEKDPNQAEYLEEILREGFSHPAVQGIIVFAGPALAGFKVMPLADEDFNNTPAGDVVDKLISEWKTTPPEVKADSRGFVDISLFHGDYDVTVMHPITKASKTLSLSLRKDTTEETIHMKIHT
ncbi:Endo-1,4-beta-xylanase [Quillaja saponaria]|uniref:Endo-1,4-beta-xylanase n=1 Tax=Quillaja saponaria TaxID=32244 RepID=A0AAD7M0A8_QUISA|nr:Endo-1,4-beta-xylanase [Quillaja saponaria]KAJ7967581.1 Endo-1,4-beta-xylanase [Quillaja saponaria]